MARNARTTPSSYTGVVMCTLPPSAGSIRIGLPTLIIADPARSWPLSVLQPLMVGRSSARWNSRLGQGARPESRPLALATSRSTTSSTVPGPHPRTESDLSAYEHHWQVADGLQHWR